MESPVSLPVRNDLVTDIRDRLAQARIYLSDIVAVNSTYDEVRLQGLSHLLRSQGAMRSHPCNEV
jgi:hypothetical protein